MGGSRWVQALLALVALSCRAAADPDMDVCDPDKVVGQGALTMPTLPQSFQLGMLVTDSSAKTSKELLLGSDGLKAYAKVTFPSYQTTIVGDYKRDQMIAMTKKPWTSDNVLCDVGNLQNAADKGQWLFGYNSTVDPHPDDPGWALHFNDFHEQYTGSGLFEGIPCNRWEACKEVKMRDQPAETVGIKFFWSDPSLWTSVAGLDENDKPYSVPVFVNMTRKVKGRIVMEQSFVFRYFNMGPSKEAFDIPSGVFCQDLSGEGVKVPKVPDYFSYDSEIILRDGFKNLIMYQKQYFDAQLQLTRLEYSPVIDDTIVPAEGDAANAVGQITLIHDLQTGIAYLLDKNYGTCIVSPVNKKEEDIVPLVPTSIWRTTNPMTFLTQKGISYTYYEEKKERGIPASLFMGLQSASDPAKPLIYEFWFSAAFQEIEGEGMWTNNKPLKFSLYPKNDPDNPTVQINMYNFDADRPNVLEYDITSCTPLDQRQELQFELGARYDVPKLPNMLEFKHQILVALLEAMSVSTLRIHNIQVGAATDSTTIRFTLLGRANNATAIQANNDQDTPSEEAVEKLRKVIDAGKLILGIGGVILDLPAVKGSLSVVTPKAIDSKSAGYNDGAMASVGIGTVLLGLLLGGGATYLIVFKKAK